MSIWTYEDARSGVQFFIGSCRFRRHVLDTSYPEVSDTLEKSPVVLTCGISVLQDLRPTPRGLAVICGGKGRLLRHSSCRQISRVHLSHFRCGVAFTNGTGRVRYARPTLYQSLGDRIVGRQVGGHQPRPTCGRCNRKPRREFRSRRFVLVHVRLSSQRGTDDVVARRFPRS